MIGARLIGGVERIIRPTTLLAHQARPTPEQAIADHVNQNVAVPRREHVRRCRSLYAIAAPNTIARRYALFDQMRVEYRERRGEQRRFDFLTLAGLLTMDERRQCAQCGQHRGAEINIGRSSFCGSAGNARHVHRARHRLADAVKAAAIAIRSRVAEGSLCREYYVGFDAFERTIVEVQRFEHCRRKIRDHDVSGRHQSRYDLLSLWLAEIERQRQFVAARLQEHRTFAGVRHRRDISIFSAFPAFDAYDLGAKITQKRCAIGPGDVASEIEHTHACEYFRHGHSYGSAPRRVPNRNREVKP